MGYIGISSLRLIWIIIGISDLDYTTYIFYIHVVWFMDQSRIQLYIYIYKWMILDFIDGISF